MKEEIQVTQDALEMLGRLAAKELPESKGIKENLLVAPVHLETRGRLETSDLQVFLDCKVIQDVWV